MEAGKIFIESPNVKYTDDFIEAAYNYDTNRVENRGSSLIIKPQQIQMHFRTARQVSKLGVMLVGWGGNNGTTFTAGVLASKHKIKWRTKNGELAANWYGSLTQSSTICIGMDEETHQPIYAPLSSLVPMVDPDNIVIDGWDISSMPLDKAMQRAKVLDVNLQDQLEKYMSVLKPRASIYYEDFIATNQKSRADNLMPYLSKWDQLEQLRADIRDCRSKNNLDKIVVIWTANTERFSIIEPNVNDTADNLMKAIKMDSPLISPSTMFAVAAILEKCPFINGSPQNTLVPGCIDLANNLGVLIGGDDFKTGQTKLKSVLVDFLIGAGIKPTAIASYNHLGNNDGKNLSSPQQFRSKEISKSNVIDDMVNSNRLLYKEGETPDHCVVIKYLPAVGDSKRAMDEYTSELMLGGRNTLVIHNICEDSLLAAPIILDLAILTEFCDRVSVRQIPELEYLALNPVLSILSYFCKAPLVPNGAPVVNSLFRQRACIESFVRACVGLAPDNNLMMEHKIRQPNLVSDNGKNGH